MSRHSNAIMDFARVGARHRLEQLKAEAKEIIAQFPDLQREYSALTATSGDVQIRNSAPLGLRAAAADEPPVRRRRRRMSAAARQAQSERMKKYWADRRKAKK